MQVKIKKLCDEAVVPYYATKGDAGMDVVATSKKVLSNTIEYGTGLSFEVPEGYMMLVFPRGSLCKKDLVMANHVGVLDAGYRGELMIRFKKIGENEYEIGDRIAQIIILPFPKVEFVESNELSKSERGDGRFGHTGGC